MNNTSGSNKLLYNEAISSLMGALPVAYIRPTRSGNATVYAVCTADGTELATFNSQEAAIFAARQHDLEPMLMH